MRRPTENVAQEEPRPRGLRERTIGLCWNDNGAWLGAMRRYLVFIAGANLLWEASQLPLYTVWQVGTLREKVVAVVHCTGADILIAVTSLVLALIVFGSGWPLAVSARWRVTAAALALGVGYTVFSEWLNVTVRETWAYSKLMPIVPLIGLGLSPLAQWIVIPLIGFWWSTRSPSSAAQPPIET